MPETGITKIEPRRWLFSLELKDFWRHRELLYFLAWRDIKIRYQQTVIGVIWAILQPVLTTLIFTVIFSSWAKFDTVDVPYPLFVLSGLMIWLFTHNAVHIASDSFTSNTNLVTKVYFPRLIVPVAATIAGLFDLIFSLGVLVILMFFYRQPVTWHLAYAPIFLIAGAILASAMGIAFSALNVKYRDVKFALPFFLQVWMIASPIFYPTSVLAEKWRLIFAINPLVGILDGFRSALFGTPFNWSVIGISFASVLVLSVAALWIFSWMEDEFADVI